MERELIRNSIRCLSCNETIESKSRYDCRTCTCGKVSVDVGLDYLKRSFASGSPSTGSRNCQNGNRLP